MGRYIFAMILVVIGATIAVGAFVGVRIQDKREERHFQVTNGTGLDWVVSGDGSGWCCTEFIEPYGDEQFRVPLLSKLPERLSVSILNGRRWECTWDELRARETLTIDEDGPDCGTEQLMDGAARTPSHEIAPVGTGLVPIEVSITPTPTITTLGDRPR